MGNRDEWDCDLARADDDEPGLGREGLDEERSTREFYRSRCSAGQRFEGQPNELCVERRIAERTVEAPVLPHDENRCRWLAFARNMRPDLGPGRVGGKWRDYGPAAGRTGARRSSCRRLGSLAHRRLDQDVDRAAAGEPHVPGLLVGDAVADHPRAAGRSGLLDLFEGGAFDAAAAHRAGDPTVGRHEHGRALGTRRRPERPDHDGTADLGAFGPPGGQGLDELLHREVSCRRAAIAGRVSGGPSSP
jgi:hypothetical protein